MKQPKRIQVRPKNQTGILDEKFRGVTNSTRNLVMNTVHPLVVISDLRKGAISSLDTYLRQQKGIPDRQVALELRKLISGTVSRSSFRILVVDHPDKPKEKGGRPSAKARAPTEAEFRATEDVRRYLKQYRMEGAVAQVAQEHEISVNTVYKYVRRVSEYEAKLLANDEARQVSERGRKANGKRSEEALRNQSRKGDS
jgi:hypothetical protein